MKTMEALALKFRVIEFPVIGVEGDFGKDDDCLDIGFERDETAVWDLLRCTMRLGRDL
jgi:hypothetical protein